MAEIKQISCDLCGEILKDNEKHQEGIIGMKKIISKYSFKFKYEGSVKQGDLCFICAKKIRDYIDNIKESKR